MRSVRVHLLFFALYRELAGTAEMELELPPGADAALVVRRLRARSDGLARLPAEPVVAVNREYAPLTTELHDGDELALLPPVAGG
jgi:molybdopterin converting factor subunit 1